MTFLEYYKGEMFLWEDISTNIKEMYVNPRPAPEYDVVRKNDKVSAHFSTENGDVDIDLDEEESNSGVYYFVYTVNNSLKMTNHRDLTLIPNVFAVVKDIIDKGIITPKALKFYGVTEKNEKYKFIDKMVGADLLEFFDKWFPVPSDRIKKIAMGIHSNIFTVFDYEYLSDLIFDKNEECEHEFSALMHRFPDVSRRSSIYVKMFRLYFGDNVEIDKDDNNVYEITFKG